MYRMLSLIFCVGCPLKLLKIAVLQKQPLTCAPRRRDKSVVVNKRLQVTEKFDNLANRLLENGGRLSRHLQRLTQSVVDEADQISDRNATGIYGTKIDRMETKNASNNRQFAMFQYHAARATERKAYSSSYPYRSYPSQTDGWKQKF